MAKIKIVFEPSDKMNLLGYILKAALERSAEDPRNLRRLQGLKKPLEISAGDMCLNLVCEKDRVVLRAKGAGADTPGPCAWVRGDLGSLLSVALRRGMVKNFLRGRLKTGGRVWRLLPLVSLLKARREP